MAGEFYPFGGTRSSGTGTTAPLTSGRETVPRVTVSNAVGPITSGQMQFAFFTPDTSYSSTLVRVGCGATAAASVTLARVGLYTVDSAGNLALVASTANDTTLFATINTMYTKTWTTPVTVNGGQQYAVGVLVTATTMPAWLGVALSTAMAAEFALAPRLTGTLASQADLPASTSTAALANTHRVIYAAIA